MSRPVRSPTSRRPLRARRTAPLAVLGLAVAASSTLAGPAPAAAPTRSAPRICVEIVSTPCAVRPRNLPITVSDLFFSKLHWSSWGGSTARGRGTYEYRTPGGTRRIKKGRGTIRLSGVKRCDGHRAYARVTVTFAGRRYSNGAC